MTGGGQKRVFRVLLFLVFILWLLPGLTWAQTKGYGVEVRARSPLQISTKPGRIVSISVLVTSYQPALETFIEEIDLPQGWQPLMPPGRFSIPSRGSVTRVLAFQIPPSARVGDYEVVYSVKNRRDYGVYDEEIFTVSILAVEGVELILVKKPVAIIAGQHYEADLQLINRSNTTRTYSIDLPDRDERFPATISPNEVTLNAGQSADLKLKGKIFQGSTSRFHFVEVRAVVTGDGGPDATTLVVDLDVIPRGGGELDIFHVLPTVLSISAMGNTGGDGVHIEWSGEGYLDEERTKRIDFLFRGPDTDDFGIYGDVDEYWLNYFTETYSFYLGDQGYPLSRLTSSGAYGRGIGFAYEPIGTGFGGGLHYVKSRWGTPEKKEYGFYVSHKVEDNLEIRFNALQKERKAYGSKPDIEDKIWSVSAEYRPWVHTLLELEYAICDTDREEALDDDAAYRVYLRGRMNGKIPYSITKVRAGTDFWGYYHDYDYISASVGYPFSDRLQGNISWYQYKDNLNLRQVDATSQTFEELLQVYFDYELSDGWYLALGYDTFTMEDRLLPAEYNYHENSWWLRVGRSMERYSYSFEARYADQSNRVNGESATAWNYNVSLSYQLTPELYVSIYGGFGDNDALADSYLMRSSSNRGISIIWDITPTLQLSCWYTRYSYEEDFADNSEQYEFIAEQTFEDESRLRFRIQRNDNSGEMETSYSVTYVIPIDIKLAKKKNVGVLQGLVYETIAEEKRGIPNVVLDIEGQSAVTDEKGMFLFPSLLPGAYLLKVDRASLGNRVPNRKVPITVEIAGYGEVTSMDIGIIDGVSLNGTVVLIDPDAGKDKPADLEGNKSYLVGDTLQEDGFLEPGGLQSVLVELKNEDEVHRRITDSWGRFLFEGLRPGKWVLKVYDINIPSSYRIEFPEQSIDLGPGDAKVVEAKVLPRKRTIKFLEEGRVVMKPGEK
ncbi:MAG: hypothetical protein VB083_11030 [Aminobacterium sp.]|uniref:hypothetical protein n=1 Tax=Aminobacterium sp. TaxID=1872491 RepID=UPI002B1F1974|nr:hypothetical protein [Aminobacterium sp.]MEA4878433.1 hypothetical protein [Aminobacterium sp.]